MENFTWCQFYNEFAHKLLEYKNNRDNLIEIVKSIFAEIELPLPILEKDNFIVDIDPFTVFGLFNKKLKDINRKKIITAFAKKINIKTAVPQEFSGIPNLNNQNATFYEFINKRQDSDIDDLWKLFESALKYADSQGKNYKNELYEYFDKAIAMKYNGNSKITMGLFWIASGTFLNLDSRNTWYIYKSGKIPQNFVSSLPLIEKNISAKIYFEIIEKITNFFNNNSMNIKNFVDLSVEAWRYSQEVNDKNKETKKQQNYDMFSDFGNVDSNNWFPKDYSPEISVEKWVELLKNPEVFNENSLKIMARMQDFGGMATCKQLADKYGASANFYNSGSSYLAKRIYENTKCPILEENTENSRWWPILYVGRYNQDKNVHGVYIWKLRSELSEALKQINLSNVKLYEEAKEILLDGNIENIYTKENFLKEVFISEDKYNSLEMMLKKKKNIILQGAPGVGKTFAAKRLAYSMIGQTDDSRIEIVQFHQNYSYEDFVMGYKPAADGFDLTEGIFYKFCIKAIDHPDKDYFFIIDEINRGNMSKIFGELLMLIENNYRKEDHAIKLAYKNEKFYVPENLYIIGMMNTADRSLAMIDYALRRRFSFFDIEPGFDSDGFKEKINSEKFRKLIDVIKDLNNVITNDKSLGKGFCIGHSYFCDKEEKYTDEVLKSIVEFDILPMLAEYWFDELQNYEKWQQRLMEIFNE